MIRDATPGDLAVIIALIRALADFEHMADQVELDPATFGGHLFGPDSVATAIVATDGLHESDPVVGYAIFFPTLSTFVGRPGIWLEDLFVRPDRRGRGYGRALIEALRERTGGRLEWNVLRWNADAIRFYQTLGAGPLDDWVTYRWLPTAPPAST